MTEAAVTEITGIRADDLAALRSADSVAFHHYEGNASIRVYVKGAGDPRVFTRREQILFPDTDSGVPGERSRLITVHGQGFGYSRDGGTAWRLHDEPNAVCFAWLYGTRSDQVWHTVAGVLRAGDRLSLRWVADNNCETIVSHGLHVDQLDLIAVRDGGTKQQARTLMFTVAHGVHPDNSGRMIRRFG